ncbi:phosphoglycerate mutase (2,3-diphosphoglycerate-independent) [Candidatus Gottesmanbacteria bacterium RIFCSPHIGHO2_01_FULL_39_10]|uniref:2,3-bisphosphoglycerate-independent phosphoglycerate mutase n=1 Tax=Candidatus Gottesmanbacteria bacterium RIFCSPHIGHO2_01_FULL_39_10 TaxID=1798375 RepID=A0A1F5ZPV2_9BACT|nr:MAG: phosphoglycerate mutase (2,3-diphosphoglycerate-independent) [Candidatus Gottesmanbacteria bacterium RIFCSPHIGHO2_01_FULL_39_10]
MKTVLLIVLDGWGVAPDSPGNAITQAKKPFYDSLLGSYPNGLLKASGEAVGLPRGEDGNTETGHLNLGAGRIVYQDLPRINMSITDGTFFQNTSLMSALSHLNMTGGNLHLLGLIGAGGVHSNIEHLFALLDFCRQQQFDRVFLHLFTDGRDSPPTSSLIYLDQVNDKIKSVGIGKIATISGRYYAMDRDFRWERTEKAYLALTEGIGKKFATYTDAVKDAYAKGETDEFITPTVITENGEPVGKIKEGDSAIFFNFRIDRPRQLTKAFVLDDFQGEANVTAFDPFAVKYFKKHDAQVEQHPPFKRGEKIKDLFFVTMTEYSMNVDVSAVAFPPQRVLYPLGRVLSEKNLKQLRIAESEKERFVTYYFNGLLEKPFPGEDRLIVPSPKVATYDLQPEMSSEEITNKILENLQKQIYSFILVNFAHPDMVAHTGNLAASIKACEAADRSLAKIIPEALSQNTSIIITGDHGNAEELIDTSTNKPDTEHSTAPVPFIYVDNSVKGKSKSLPAGILADVSPTILAILGIPKPTNMVGRNLLENF